MIYFLRENPEEVGGMLTADDLQVLFTELFPESLIDELAVEVSPETITEAEGDRIFYSSYGNPADTGQTTVVAGPLWASMDAVKEGRATEVSDETWFLGLGPTGAGLVLDDLQAKLGK